MSLPGTSRKKVEPSEFYILEVRASRESFPVEFGMSGFNDQELAGRRRARVAVYRRTHSNSTSSKARVSQLFVVTCSGPVPLRIFSTVSIH